MPVRRTAIPESKKYPTPRSGNIQAAGYDKTTRAVEVEFTTGAVYRYLNVPYETYRNMRRARSIGRYFNRYIKSSFQCEKLTYLEIVNGNDEVSGQHRWISTDTIVRRTPSRVTAT